jgi:hypothetical protein
MTLLQGDCHCGQIKIEFASEQAISAFSPRACQCGFCRRHDAAMISDRSGQLTLAINDGGTAIYRFGLGITDFHICKRCGVFVAATWKDEDGTDYGVLNIRSLSTTEAFAVPVPVSFDGESRIEREERRRANWTPVRLV